MDRVKDLMDETIISEIQNVNELESGSDEKSKAIEGVTKLYRVRVDEINAETEREKIREQKKNTKIDRWVTVGVQVLTVCGGWIVYDIWNRRGLKFEEDGVVKSAWYRNLISKMTPKK